MKGETIYEAKQIQTTNQIHLLKFTHNDSRSVRLATHCQYTTHYNATYLDTISATLIVCSVYSLGIKRHRRNVTTVYIHISISNKTQLTTHDIMRIGE